VLDNCPVGVVVTDRYWHLEFGGEFHEQLDVLPAIEQLGKGPLRLRVVDGVVEVRLLRVLKLVHLVDEAVLLLQAVVQLVEVAATLLVLDAIDDDLREHALQSGLYHLDEVVWVADELHESTLCSRVFTTWMKSSGLLMNSTSRPLPTRMSTGWVIDELCPPSKVAGTGVQVVRLIIENESAIACFCCRVCGCS